MLGGFLRQSCVKIASACSGSKSWMATTLTFFAVVTDAAMPCRQVYLLHVYQLNFPEHSIWAHLKTSNNIKISNKKEILYHHGESTSARGSDCISGMHNVIIIL